MTTPYANVERDGMTTIIKLAKQLCRIVSAVRHILQGKWGDNPTVMLLVEAIEALCPLIAAAEIEAISIGGLNEVPDDDFGNIVGISANKPPAGDPNLT